MEKFTLKAEKRDIFGKKLKQEREKGRMPAVLYGKGKETESVFISLKDFEKLFKKAGETSVVEIELGNKKDNAMIYDIEYDPVSGVPLHADFYIVKMDEPIEAAVPLVFEGESAAVKAGGILVKVVHELNIKALPADIPHEIIIDISKLKSLEDKILVSDLNLPAKISVIGKEQEELIALIESPKEEEAAAPAEINFDAIEATKEKKEEEEEK